MKYLVSWLVAFAVVLIALGLLAPLARAQVASPSRGGTGTSTIPLLGQLLLGNGLGGYSLVATSSLGISGDIGGLATTSIDTEAELEAILTDVLNVFTNNDGALSDDDLANNSTSDLPEGSRLYFTTQRVQDFLDALAKGFFFSTTSADYWDAQQIARTADDLTNNSIEDLSDVATITENYGDLLHWNGTTWADIATSSLGIHTAWGSIAGALSAQSDLQAALDNKLSLSAWFGTTTDVLDEGSVNKYFTDARARSAVSETIAGVDYSSGSGVFSLTSGYTIPLAASTSEWGSYYVTPSTRITAGAGIDWSGNTLDVTVVDTNTTYTGGDGLTLTGTDFDCDTASGSVFGCLSSADWTTFNTKLSVAVTAIGPAGQAADGPTVTLATSSDTNVGLTITGSGDALTYTSSWTGTLADLRVSDTLTIGSGSTVADGALSANVSLLGQTIAAAELASADFGSFTCSGSCTIDNGAISNAMLANSTISGISFGSNLADLTATNGTLTFSGAYNGGTARTVGINLASANTWTALQTINYASTTFLGNGQGATFATVSGNVGIGTTTPYAKLSVVGPVVAEYIHATSSTAKSIFKGPAPQQYVEKSFSYSTTSWSGTTTIPLGPAYTAQTWIGAKCFTDTGTVGVSFYDGSNRMNYIPTASTTVNENVFGTNNTFTASEKRYVDIGNPASSPKSLACTITYEQNN